MRIIEKIGYQTDRRANRLKSGMKWFENCTGRATMSLKLS